MTDVHRPISSLQHPDAGITRAQNYAGMTDSDRSSATVQRLVQRYESYMKGSEGTGGKVLESFEVENRMAGLSQLGISQETIEDRAKEAVERTRKKYVSAFKRDGLSDEAAQERALDFLSDPDRCVELIWKEERDMIQTRDKKLDSIYKNVVVAVNLFVLLPIVLLYFSSLPIAPVFEMAKFYVSKNCYTLGGIKCNGEGAQGQKLPDLRKVFTPPKPIVRKPVSPVNRDTGEDVDVQVFPDNK